MSSNIIGLFFWALEAVKARQGHLALCHVSLTAQKLLSICGAIKGSWIPDALELILIAGVSSCESFLEKELGQALQAPNANAASVMVVRGCRMAGVRFIRRRRRWARDSLQEISRAVEGLGGTQG